MHDEFWQRIFFFDEFSPLGDQTKNPLQFIQRIFMKKNAPKLSDFTDFSFELAKLPSPPKVYSCSERCLFSSPNILIFMFPLPLYS